MPLLGNGLRNGSPFYPGYEYQAPNLVAPTGLLTLASLMPQGYGTGARTSASKKKGETTEEDETKTIIPGTLGTSADIKEKLDAIDASIASAKSKMYSKFTDTKNYPTKESAIEGVKEEYTQLQNLYAQKNNIKSLIPAANSDLQNLQTSLGDYTTNGSLGEVAVKKVGDVFMSMGLDDNKKLKTYQNAFSDLNEANNIVESVDVDGNKTYAVKAGDYFTTSKQKGAFNDEVSKILTTARASTVSGGTVTPTGDLSNDAYYINSVDYSSNKAAVDNAAKTLYDNLTTDAKADVSSQMYETVYGLKENETLKSKSGVEIITTDELASIQKQINGEDLTGADYKNISSGIVKFAGAKIKDEVPTYYESQYKIAKTKASIGAGETKKKPVTKSTERKTLVIPDVKKGTVGPTQGTETTLDVETVNISDDPLTITMATEDAVFNERTGEYLDLGVGNNTFKIKGVDRGVNPTNGKTETWAWGITANPDNKPYLDKDGVPTDIEAEGATKNPTYTTPDKVYTPLTDVLQKKIEDVYDVDLNTMEVGAKKTTTETETLEW